MTSLKRNLEHKINELLRIFPAVLIVGTRQCGKTSIAKTLRPQWQYLDLESAQTFDRISNDISFFFKENPTNLIIDEAQVYPEIFNELRGVIDSNRKTNNRFIITGSSSLELLSNAADSLAGRVAIVELASFKGNEVIQKPISPFYKLFESVIDVNTLEEIKKIPKVSTHQELKKHFLKGGYPDAALSLNDNAYSQWMENYFSTYINRDIRSLFPKLDLVKFRRFTRLLSTVSGQVINKSNIARAIEVSDKTIKDYLDIADGTFVWRTIHSYEKSATKSLIKMPKGGFRDSGLLHFHKNIITMDQLDKSVDIGHDFEHFVIEEIIKGLETSFATNWKYNYYRTRGGAEVDFILEGSFGVVPIEIKYGVKVNLKKLSSLRNFVKENNLPFGIVVNNGDKIEMICPEIIQIPAVFL
jgi:predicted AAA+ superfamily ATPase